MYFTLPNQIFRIDNCSKRTLWLSLSFIHLNRREKAQDLRKTLLNVEINETRKYAVGEYDINFVLTWKAKKANKKENVYAASRCQEIEEATN